MKSGVDFPANLQNLTTVLTDGHTDYAGARQYLSTPPKYTAEHIADRSNEAHFRERS